MKSSVCILGLSFEIEWFTFDHGFGRASEGVSGPITVSCLSNQVITLLKSEHFELLRHLIAPWVM
jgi:hypothetical protein